MTALDTYLATLPDRCPGCQFHVPTQGCHCTPADDWSTFTAALRSVARDDGTVHQADMRPKIRGVIAPARIGQLYRKARDTGLITDTGDREPSDDAAGRNLDKLDRIYLLRSAA